MENPKVIILDEPFNGSRERNSKETEKGFIR